jgi:hypothetical protein
MELIANLALFGGVLLVALLGFRWANKKANQTISEMKNPSESSEHAK